MVKKSGIRTNDDEKRKNDDQKREIGLIVYGRGQGGGKKRNKNLERGKRCEETDEGQKKE